MVSLQMQEKNSNVTHSFVNALICVQCSEHLSYTMNYSQILSFSLIWLYMNNQLALHDWTLFKFK